jgi:NAD(P)-dependent dehydrogenase (short-subunit alcohol dehydrogenase family)
VTEQGAVLVAGAAGRLGTAVAKEIALRGAPLVLTDMRRESLDAVSRELDRGCVKAAIAADCRDQEAVEELVRSAAELAGGVAAVVNAAGIEGPVGPFEELDLRAVVDVYEINVFAVFALLKALVPHMRRRGRGRIVNVASGAGLSGSEAMAAYSSSKHALVGLTRSLARELAPAGISVNAVCPGCIESPMMDRIESALAGIRGEQDASFVSSIPAERYARPQEIANVIAYLALEAPVYLTGAALLVDGGLYA